MAELKITFIGDIMCEGFTLKAAKQRNGTYDFSSVFSKTQGLFAKSDFVIGNLETPLAGEKAVYTNSLYAFNTPDSFADAIKSAGINLVAIANNHCLDRGTDGLLRTIRVLNDRGIQHCGTRCKDWEDQEAAYFTLDGIKFAVINYTYGTNYALNKNLLPADKTDFLNLLRPQQESIYLPRRQEQPRKKKNVVKRGIGFALSKLSEEQRIKLKKLMKKPYNYARADDFLDKNSAAPYVDKMQRDIIAAKSNADIVFFAPHIGGQFNLEPGAFSKFVVEKASEAGCDAVIASHAHVVQRAENRNGIPCFYSIGNFSMSPNSVYLLHEHLPDYGICVHIYIQEKKIAKVTFSILKIVESRREPLTVWPADAYEKILNSDEERKKFYREIGQIYETVTGNRLTSVQVQKEYDLYDFS